MSQNFRLTKDGGFDTVTTSTGLKIPVVPDVTLIDIQPEGSIVCDQATNFIYVSTGTAWVLSAGNGDVVGPGGATNNAAAVYDGVTGKLIKNSSLIVSGTTASIAKFNATTTGGFVYTGTTAGVNDAAGAQTATLNSKIGTVTFIDMAAIPSGNTLALTINNTAAGSDGSVSLISNNIAAGSALALQFPVWTPGVSIVVNIANTGTAASSGPIAHGIQFVSYN